MRVIQAFFYSGNELNSPELQNSVRALAISAVRYKILFPEDYLVFYGTRNICKEIKERYFDGREHQYYDQIISVDFTPKEWLHDTSRFWVISKQVEPYVYLDADFWVTEESRDSIEDLKQTILTTPGFYLAHNTLYEEYSHISIASDLDSDIQRYLTTFKEDIIPWIKASQVMDLSEGQYCHSMVCGGTPVESYVVGTETVYLHKYLKRLDRKGMFTRDLHEYASSKFSYLVGRVYGINVDGLHSVGGLHLGGGCRGAGLLGSQCKSKESALEIWKAVFDVVENNLDDLSEQFFSETVEKCISDYYKNKLV